MRYNARPPLRNAETVNYVDMASSDSLRVLRNTYMLLSMTLIFSAIMAGLSLAFALPYSVSLIAMLAAFGLSFFIPKLSNSSSGIVAVFAYTGLLGLSLGPLLAHYLALPAGGGIIMSALGLTGVIFFSLSAYVLVSKRNFSFMGGFLMIGMIVVIVASIASIFLNVPGFSVAISAAVVLLMSGLILFETSNIIHGGETNYIMATVQLYMTIFNLFTSLLNLLGFTQKD